MPSWFLDDAAELAALYPYTFHKPSPEVIGRLAEGERVKLIFRFESSDPDAPAAERMWVLIDQILPEGRFLGRLDNTPRFIPDLRADDVVHFETRHITNTEQHDATGGRVARYAPRCYVTRRVLDDGCPVGYLYREAPDDAQDSGWRITANDESDAYMDEAANLACVSLGVVLNLDDSILDLLDAPEGAAFVRDPRTDDFVACDDEDDTDRDEGEGDDETGTEIGMNGRHVAAAHLAHPLRQAGLEAILQAHGREAGRQSVDLFVEHHLEELPADYWQAQLGTPRPDARAVLGLLELRQAWDDEDCACLDYSLPDDATPYVLAVRMRPDGRIEAIALES